MSLYCFYYHPLMCHCNVLGRICQCVHRLCRLQAQTFERLDLETSFLLCTYIVRISRLISSIKVLGSRTKPRQQRKCLCVLLGFQLLNVLTYKLRFWYTDTFSVHLRQGKVTYLGRGVKINIVRP